MINPKLGIAILLISFAFAQYSQSDWMLSILSILFGSLPSNCSSEISPQCIQCIGVVKFIPFVFFFSIFYFVFYFVFLRTVGKAETSIGGVTTTSPSEVPPTAKKIAVLVSLSLAIALLHFQTIQTSFKQVIFWAGVAFVISAFLVAAPFGEKGSPVAWIILLLIILGLMGYLFSLFSPQLEEWESLCS